MTTLPARDISEAGKGWRTASLDMISFGSVFLELVFGHVPELPRPGEEVFLTFRDLGGSGLFPHHDRLYLQFRKGRLAGWKGDWGENWMWR